MPLDSTIASHSLDDQEEVCPICLLSSSESVQFCSGPCKHQICVLDAERILLAKSRLPLDGETLDPYMLVPTLGRCPICRQGMNLFEMKRDDGQDLCQTNTDVSQWPIANMTFIETGGQIRVWLDPLEGPRIYCDSIQGTQPESESYQLFNSGSFFHDQSRTFHGQVRLPNDKHDLTCIFQFSSDLRFVALGVMMDQNFRIVHRFGPGGRILKSSTPSIPRERPKYHENCLWGNTFCQFLMVGVASYHFLNEEEAYISYEHTVSSQWPPLDDGSPIPTRVKFRNTSWDADARTFRGEICWQEDFDTTWQGCRKWIYEMRFDSKFTFIASGSVYSQMRYHDDALETSNYGDDLVYINAAIDELFQNMVERTEDHEEISEQFARLSLPLRVEWSSEGASGRVLAMLHQALTQFVLRKVSPVDFNLS